MNTQMLRHPFIFSDQWNYRIQRHAAFWIFWWIFQGFLYAFAPYASLLSYFERLPIALVDSLVYMASHIFLAYSLMYFVIPVYLIKEKYMAAAGWVVILFVATAVIASSLGRFVIPVFRSLFFPESYKLPVPNKEQAFFLALLAGLRGGITIGGIAAAIKLMKYWYAKEQRNLQLQKENVASQLQLLKAQVHPHFLFNTLNNIYSYTQNTSTLASGLITRLSDLLRFILYETDQPLVSLSNELKMIRDYIDLEKIRYGNTLDLHVQLPEKTNDLYIAPLLLLPFIENSFKHGTSTMLEQPWISLEINLRDNEMHMKLLNGKIKESISSGQPPGIGIQNVKKRLDLLYPEKHDLSIANEDEVFIVNLKIGLEQKKESFIKSFQRQQETTHA